MPHATSAAWGRKILLSFLKCLLAAQNSSKTSTIVAKMPQFDKYIEIEFFPKTRFPDIQRKLERNLQQLS